MECPNCGYLNTDDMRICLGCGETIIQVIPPGENLSSQNINHQDHGGDQFAFTPPEINQTIESIKKSLEEIDSAETVSLTRINRGAATANQTDSTIIRKGGFWIRFLAFMIDQLIIYLISLLLLFIGAVAVGMHYSPIEGNFLERLGEVITFPYVITLVILAMVYYTYFIGASGQTIGKLICRLRVVQANGEPVSYGQAFLRWVGYLVSSIFFYLGYFWIVIDNNRQGWHDKIADTYVVRENG